MVLLYRLPFVSLSHAVESVQALVDCGAAVNAQNNMTGATPLHMVAQSSKGSIDRRLQVIDLLIASGANVEQADNYGSLPVHAFRNDTEDEANEDSQRFVSKLEPQRPEIQDAIDEGCVPKLKEILAKDSAAADRRLSVLSRTPVDYAVDKLIQAAEEEEDISKGDSIGILKELLSTGGNANGEDKEANDAALIGEINEPPLYKVVVALRELYKQGEKASATSSCASLETAVDLLVQAGAVVTPETTQLLHQAARRNEVTFACFLVQRLRVDPNAKGRQGMTPLHFAARSGQIEMVVSVV